MIVIVIASIVIVIVSIVVVVIVIVIGDTVWTLHVDLYI